MVGDLMQRHAVAVAVQLPSDISKGQREVLLAEFERARLHLLTAIITKNTFMTQPPFRAFAIAHPDKAIAKQAWEDC